MIRRGWEAYERGDLSAALADVSPDIVVYQAPPLPDASTYHGREGMLQALFDWAEGRAGPEGGGVHRRGWWPSHRPRPPNRAGGREQRGGGRGVLVRFHRPWRKDGAVRYVQRQGPSLRSHRAASIAISESIDKWRALYEAFNRGDIDAAVQNLHPEVELKPALIGPGVKDHYRGRDELKEFFETITDVWDSLTVEVEEMIEAPDGRLVAVENWRARGRDGIEINTRLVDVYAFRDGLVIRGDGFRDKAEALEAVGLTE